LKDLGLIRVCGKDSGLTRLEITFFIVVAVVLLTLVISLTLNALKKSAVARAHSDIHALASAVSNFFSDLGYFPSCNAPDCDPLSNGTNNLRFLVLCSRPGYCADQIPEDTRSLWNFAANQESVPERNNAFYHLTTNNPNINEKENEAGKDYKSKKWNGPYLTKLYMTERWSSPFDKAYVIHIGAMQKNGCPVNPAGRGCGTGGKGWILSAGPDGILDTAPAASVPSGDDIGMILFSRN
jgi:Tfp pilus assembly protein PilE